MPIANVMYATEMTTHKGSNGKNEGNRNAHIRYFLG